jgi:hypothetical protein
MLKSVFDVMKFIDYCFHWEQPFLSFSAFMVRKKKSFEIILLIKILFLVIYYYCLEF